MLQSPLLSRAAPAPRCAASSEASGWAPQVGKTSRGPVAPILATTCDTWGFFWGIDGFLGGLMVFSGGIFQFFFHDKFIGISWGFLMGWDLMGSYYSLGTHDIYWNLAFQKDILLETKATTCRFWSLLQPFDWTGLEMVGEGWCSASTSHSMCTLAESCCPA